MIYNTERDKVLAQINYLKDKVLPARTASYRIAKEQLARASMSQRRCLADWKVYRTTINVFIEASMTKREAEAELRKLRIILKTMEK
jgi:hypothetical protein